MFPQPIFLSKYSLPPLNSFSHLFPLHLLIDFFTMYLIEAAEDTSFRVQDFLIFVLAQIVLCNVTSSMLSVLLILFHYCFVGDLCYTLQYKRSLIGIRWKLGRNSSVQQIFFFFFGHGGGGYLGLGLCPVVQSHVPPDVVLQGLAYMPLCIAKFWWSSSHQFVK